VSDEVEIGGEMMDISSNHMNWLQDVIGYWGDQTFTEATPESIMAHLEDEIKELKNANTIEQKMKEAADCTILLFQFAHKVSFSLCDAVIEKHIINKQRKWGQPDERGVVRHID
jgi:hypothetical protein